MSTRDLLDEPDLEFPREEAPLEDALRRAPRFEDPLRDLLADELPRVEALLLVRDSPDWLRCDLLLPELPEDELFEPRLPDLLPEDEDRAPREEDDLVPDDLEELLRALLLDLCAMEILPPFLLR